MVPVHEKIQTFIKDFPVKTFGKGEYLITPDSGTKCVYVLQEGIVRVVALSKDGVEATLNIFKPTSFFPMLWVLHDKMESYFYEALTDVQVVCIPKDRFLMFIEKEHDVAFDLLKRIYRGLSGYMKRMEALLTGNAYNRVITTILIHTLRNQGQENKTSFHLTHNHIATESGITRETVTREMKKLQEKSLVSYDKDILIVSDISKLESELLA